MVTSSDFICLGTELEIFSRARHWKAYWGAIVSRYLGSRVLEVGAGTGATVRQAFSSHQEMWLALEPDARLADQMRHGQVTGTLPGAIEIRVGTLANIGAKERFDTILYIDVLEHIEDDRSELQRAYRHLASGGYLVVLAPAHQSLFTAFDSVIGHHRRYSRQGLIDLGPSGLKPQHVAYLDSVGLLASVGNRFVLRSSARHLDRYNSGTTMVPASRIFGSHRWFSSGEVRPGCLAQGTVGRRREPLALASLAVIGLIGFAFERLLFGTLERATVQRWGMVRQGKA